MTDRKVLSCAPLLASLLLVGCARDVPEPFVRLSGPAPQLADAPANRALLVIFWATWCPPCVQEAHSLLALSKALPDRLAIIIVSEDEQQKAVTDFFGGAPPPALHLRLDQGWQTAHDFRVDRLPTSILLVDGKAVARFDGPRAWSSNAVHSTLTRLIDEAPAPREKP